MNISLEMPSLSFPLFKARSMYKIIWSFRPPLDLSCNKLTGPIRPSFENLNKLHVLGPQNNHLSGIIPYSLLGLKSLGFMDLSQNELSGEIPLSLQNLSFFVEIQRFEQSAAWRNPHRRPALDIPTVKLWGKQRIAWPWPSTMSTSSDSSHSDSAGWWKNVYHSSAIWIWSCDWFPSHSWPLLQKMLGFPKAIVNTYQSHQNMNPHAHIDIIISEQMLTPSQLEVIRKLAFVVVFNVFCQNSEFEQFL